MTASRKLSSLAAILLLAGLTLSACGDKEDATRDKAASKPTARDDTSFTKANFASSVAAASQKAGTSHLEMIIEAGGQTVTASGDQIIAKKFEDNAALMTMDYGAAGLDEVKVLVVDGQFYMDFGRLTEGKYAKADLTDTDDPLTQQLAPMIEQLDTSKQIEAMSSAMTSLKKKGAAEKIDGVECQPYAVVVDTSKMDAFSALPAESRNLIPDSLTYTMFMGSDGLLRRMTYGFSGVKGTVNLTKWGEPVEITAPSAGDLSDKDLSTLLTGSSA
jgi:hypothetical protein